MGPGSGHGRVPTPDGGLSWMLPRSDSVCGGNGGSSSDSGSADVGGERQLAVGGDCW